MSGSEAQITFGYNQTGELEKITSVYVEVTYASGARDVVELAGQPIGPQAHITGGISASRNMEEIGPDDDSHISMISPMRVQLTIDSYYAQMKWRHTETSPPGPAWRGLLLRGERP
jgi:hypothetical protein